MAGPLSAFCARNPHATYPSRNAGGRSIMAFSLWRIDFDDVCGGANMEVLQATAHCIKLAHYYLSMMRLIRRLGFCPCPTPWASCCRTYMYQKGGSPKAEIINIHPMDVSITYTLAT